MNTNMTGFKCFSEIFASCALDEKSCSIARVNMGGWENSSGEMHL